MVKISADRMRAIEEPCWNGTVRGYELEPKSDKEAIVGRVFILMNLKEAEAWLETGEPAPTFEVGA